MGFLDEAMEASRERARALEGVATRASLAESIRSGVDARGFSLVIEYKRCSPSRGFISYRTPWSYIRETVDYADGYSVITEPAWFCGSIELIPIFSGYKPVLMKDFISGRSQLELAARLGASAVLVIAEAHTHNSVETLCREARSLGLEVLLEASRLETLSTMATACPGSMVGINSRRLDTLAIRFDDMLRDIRRARSLLEDRIIVAESGITSPERALKAINAGADALLIGTSIMTDPGMARRIWDALDRRT